MTTERKKRRMKEVMPAVVLLFLMVADGSRGSDAEGTPDLTFYEHVLPIFQANCITCHRPGQIAPMSLETYEEARPWIKSIGKEVRSERMPPFYAVGPIGRFKDDLRLRRRERDLILRWIESGARKGDPSLGPVARVWDDKEWPLGEPDVIVSFPPYTPGTDNKDENVTLFSDFVTDERLYIRGLHLRTGGSEILHHASLFHAGESLSVPENMVLGVAINMNQAELLNTWLPGMADNMSLEDGLAREIPLGRRFALVAHFAPTDDQKEQRLDVGVYFAEGVIDKTWGTIGKIFGSEIRIPPHEARFELRSIETFPVDAYVYQFYTHMHLRGKQTHMRFHYPNGETEMAYNLPRFSFDWQRNYRLVEPMFVPEGTKLEVVGIWDNSADNEYNPDPSRAVHWGLRTEDEMFGGYVDYFEARPREIPIQVRNGRAVE